MAAVTAAAIKVKVAPVEVKLPSAVLVVPMSAAILRCGWQSASNVTFTNYTGTQALRTAHSLLTDWLTDVGN